MQGSRKEAVAEAQLWVKAAHLEKPTSRQQASESTSACHLDNRALRGKLFRLPYEWQTMKGCIPWYLLVKFLHGLQTTDNCALFLRPWWFRLLANTEEWGAIWGSPPKTLFLQKWENRIERHAFKSTTSSKEKEVNVYKSQNVNHRNYRLNPAWGLCSVSQATWSSRSSVAWMPIHWTSDRAGTGRGHTFCLGTNWLWVCSAFMKSQCMTTCVFNGSFYKGSL